MQEILKMCEETIINKLKYIPNLLSNCNIYENDNYTTKKSPYNTSMFNIVWVKNINSNNYRNIIKEVKKIFYQNSFALWYGPSSYIKISESQFIELGFTKEANEIGMFLNTKSINLTHYDGKTTRIHEVNNKKELMDFISVLLEYDSYVEEYFLKIYEELNFAKNTPYRYFYLTVNTQVVCIASIFFNGSFCGLFDVITVPSHRRKGYAQQFMKFLLAFV